MDIPSKISPAAKIAGSRKKANKKGRKSARVPTTPARFPPTPAPNAFPNSITVSTRTCVVTSVASPNKESNVELLNIPSSSHQLLRQPVDESCMPEDDLRETLTGRHVPDTGDEEMQEMLGAALDGHDSHDLDLESSLCEAAIEQLGGSIHEADEGVHGEMLEAALETIDMAASTASTSDDLLLGEGGWEIINDLLPSEEMEAGDQVGADQVYEEDIVHEDFVVV